MKQLFNNNWFFKKNFQDENHPEATNPWIAVEIPHDWLIYDTNNLYESSTGWYKKEFRLSSFNVATDHVSILFEGVYQDCSVYVNEKKVGEWKYGYSTFEFDITSAVKQGKNEIVVQVKYRSPNSRWYSGAGIYRNVWFTHKNKNRIVSDGVYITPVRGKSDLWRIEVTTELVIDGGRTYYLQHTLISDENEVVGQNEQIVSTECRAKIRDLSNPDPSNHDPLINATSNHASSIMVEIESSDTSPYFQLAEESELYLTSPKLWAIGVGNLYYLKTELFSQKTSGEIILLDTVTNRFGCREISYHPGEGFLLNGTPTEIFGVCEHHDLGCLGAAMNKTALRRRLETLQQMGVNAIRTAHNMPAVELMELADEMGILICTEAFDMWRSPKTTYDYARFFDEWVEKDVASWVRRDRNCPSVIMWSIGNEIYDTHGSEEGIETTKMLKALVELHDPKAHAPVTLGSNYMPWENARKCADLLKLVGYNYADEYYHEHHQRYPDWVIFGSETSSTVQSRGIYRFPFQQPILADDDEQCSSLGNSSTSWGAKSTESCLIAHRDACFCLGQFIWTGFDYIGEPTPYHTKNSYFGQIDTAGFPKDSFYVYQSAWTDYKKAPMVHIFPYWDFSPGQMIDVRVCSNAPKVELFFTSMDSYSETPFPKLEITSQDFLEKEVNFSKLRNTSPHKTDNTRQRSLETSLNEVSLGVFEIDHAKGQQLVGNWQIPYQTGVLRAVAYDENGQIIAEDLQSSFGDPQEIVVTADKEELLANGEDLIFLEISTVDKRGTFVANANNRMSIKVTGAARLVGIDNGDSTDYDQYKETSKRLFSGKLLAVLAATDETGLIEVQVNSLGLATKVILLQAIPGTMIEGSSTTFTRNMPSELNDEVSGDEVSGDEVPNDKVSSNEVPIRKIELLCETESLTLNENQQRAVVTAKLYPANTTYTDIHWRVTNKAGIDTNIATYKLVDENNDKKVEITALGDGEFCLRCMTNNGAKKPRLITQLEFKITGIGQAFLNPYQFIAGGLFTNSNIELTNGNDRGIATDREKESHVGFANVDFGEIGADTVTLPIFCLSGEPFSFDIWEGMPKEAGSEKLCTVNYDKGSIWNTYQEETYTLPRRLKGITTICFVFRLKVHLKGFSFVKIEKAYEKLPATTYDYLSGDSYTVTENGVENIGNNVSLIFQGMNFTKGLRGIQICGATPLAKNTIRIRFFDGEQTIIQNLDFTKIEFTQSPNKVELVQPHNKIELTTPQNDTSFVQTFALENVEGMQEVTFIFLPGSQFDFRWLRFLF